MSLDTSTSDYNALLNELAVLTNISNDLAELDARFQKALAELIREIFREDYTAAQQAEAAARARIETIARQHPEWFEKPKTLKTPFGSVAFRSTAKLEIPNEEITIALIEMLGSAEAPLYIRERKFPNLEALEALDDEDLKRLRINRVTRDSCTITPAKLDLGKAVADAEPAMA